VPGTQLAGYRPQDTIQISAILQTWLGESFRRLAVLNYADTAELAVLSGSFLLGVFLSSLYRQKQQQYLRLWSGGWFLLSLQSLFWLLSQTQAHANWFSSLAEWLFALVAITFYAAAQLYARKKPSVSVMAALGAIACVWAYADGFWGLKAPLNIGTAVVFFLAATVFWSEDSRHEGRIPSPLGAVFFGWGLLTIGTAAASYQWDIKDAGRPFLQFLPMVFAGIFMVTSAFEEERRRLERNMLALANLNLATSSFPGSAVEKMLAQALERMLDVAHIPFGALCVHHAETNEKSVVVAGFSKTFGAVMGESRLDEYVIELVARLGGLVNLRNLSSKSEYERLEKEESFHHLRNLLVEEGLQTIVGISLQAKEKPSGALVLGTKDGRTLTPPELRLLVGLAHQLGMAVENSYLLQQTGRRTEELHVLNEVGRAISSTLDLDSLLEQIYSGMRRLVDVPSFFIAFYDPKAEKVRYEFEVGDGERLPKRSRPAGNHLVEHVIRTRQPVLIGGQYAQQAKRLGFEPLRNLGSICAVPLIRQDHAIAVMVMHSPKERAFDEGHVELLRVLAGEAGIAIENARLFAEEQKKSRQLTLINNVSGHAITTLDPDEMLGKIAQEIANSLAYDHIGIAILNYSTKELIVEAEAGKRLEAAGRRISLGEGVLGQVARSGQVAMVVEASASTPRLVLPHSVSCIALPVTYAEQLLGVLYVESSEPSEFPEQEVLLLRTLADLFAGALHNALTFQKAQEQAITDGLTGVKTHRFLMEALSAEWKRSTRANRLFAIVLMDLDRFKFVNDFYGHLEGDVVLQRVGHILEQNCRRSDVVARYGGDEFVILMPETSVEQARQLALKLRGWVASDPLLRDKNITASFGIAGFPAHGSTPQELLQVADSSMYISKHQGGNAVSSAEQGDPNDRKRWKRDVLEAYLGVTLKRLFATGPEAFEEIYRRLEQFTRSLKEQGVSGSENELPSTVVETVTSLAFAIDAKDQYTQGHSQKVSAYAVLLAQDLDLTEAEIEEIRLAGLLHDIGKVGIPESILNKSGPLDAIEWDTMKTHTELGAKILEPLHSMARIRAMVRHHHEFYDGTGYPDRLQGENIPYGSRVIAIADAYDTITSERAYKKPRTPEEAFAELERCAARQFDPDIVRVFIEAMRRVPVASTAPKEYKAQAPSMH